MSTSWDVAIVGAGCAGAPLAILLAERGWSVVLVDAAHFPRQKVCGEFLSPSAWSCLRELGVFDTARRQAATLHTMRLGMPGDRTVAIDFGGPMDARPAALSRFALDALLVDRAAERGVRVMTGCRAREVCVDRGRAVGVVVSPGDRPEATHTLQAPLIVAADGRQSLVVRQTGRRRERTLRLVGFKRHWQLPLADGARLAATIAMHSLPGGYVGVCPVEGGAYNVCGVIPRSIVRRFRGSLDHAIADWTRSSPSLARVLAEGAAVGPWYSVPEVSVQRAFPRLPGVLYLGDACGTIEPLTGQGMALAMASAQLATAFLGRVGHRLLGRTEQVAYQKLWQTRFEPHIARTAWLGWLLRHPRLLQTLMPLEHFSRRAADTLLDWGYRATLLPARARAQALAVRRP